MKGKQIGRTIGYPTANIDISKRDILLRGVFCVKAAIEDDTKEPGTIIQEIQKGFTIKDRLLRPSLVGCLLYTSDAADE